MAEQERLERLRDILTGKQSARQEELVTQMDALDYLWAHFVEYRGTQSTANLVLDPSFLKRVRAGIDRSLKDWMIATQILGSFEYSD